MYWLHTIIAHTVSVALFVPYYDLLLCDIQVCVLQMEINQYDITIATHYAITMGNDIARDAHCEITMSNYLTTDIHYDVTMSRLEYTI